MTPLEYIALAQALAKIGKEAYDYFGKIMANLKQNKELTEDERKAFEALMTSDAAQPYAQQQPE